MQLNNCCNASLANPSCLAGERPLAVDDDLALLRQSARRPTYRIALRCGVMPLITKHHKRRMKMKRLLLTFAILAVATALTAPVFAGLKDAKNKAECEMAGGVWIENDNKC